ncbi:Rne/Rng family ribonuclease, partial [Streptomyces asoensis]|uniref:Rne/Rng family ribonuclease n=1 Tax=Streptomyces asoensis TaxID=249586 RepID=UPI0033F9CF70
MLEPTESAESVQDSEANTPSDTLPPRRRRRAASRPAGPPTAAADTSAEITTPAIPAVESAEQLADEDLEDGTAATAAAEAAAAVEAPAEAAPRTRRRATRRASAPVGAPADAEAAETVVPVAAAEQDAPAAEAAVEEPAEDGGPRRARRRATRRVSAPAATAEATAETAEATAETVEPAAGTAEADRQPAVESAPAEAEPETAPRTRRRATRRATAPAGAPEAVTPAVAETAAPAQAEVRAEAPAVTEEPSAEAVEPAPRTRRRATRRAAAPAEAEVPQAPQAPETVEEPAVAAVEEPKAPEAPAAPAEAAPAEEDAGPRRGRRRAVRRAAGGFTAPSQENAEADAPRRPARPAVAVFQAPVFAEPQFQTPQRAAAEAAAAEAEVTEPEEPEETPELVEEPAGSRRRRRRRAAGAGEEAASGRTAAPAAATPPAAEEEPESEPEEADEAAEDVVDGDDEGEDTGSRRRRRRGGRRRRRGDAADGEGDSGDAESDEFAAEQAAQDAEDTAEQEDEDAEDADEEPGGSTAGSRRRRRRRRRAGDSSGEAEQPGDGDPERTVVKVREPRKPSEPSDEVQSIKGSTRLEAKKQRRREGREQGRRRVPIITEAEFLARREAVERVMVVRQSGERTQIGVLEDNVLVEHYVNKEQATSYVGNVYLGKVQNVLPSMEAAFIDIGKGRNAVLYAGEVNFEALGMANGPRRIEAALKSGQSVLVQVTKDPIGHKGARLTSQVSLPGRYLVYVPEGSMTGISRKLPDTERARLKTILKKIVPEDAGVIVRTAAEGASEDELRRDVERLQGQWEDIQKKAKNGGGSNAPSLLYGEPDMTVRVVRDIFNEDFSKVIVSGEEAWSTIHGYVSHVAPDLTDRLSKWTSEVDVFATYRIDEQLAKALDRKVWLPSGGSLVIDRTEAMVVVDVNTGKFTGQGGNLEETVTRNNLEAAEEIVRQLRLRDLGGIIVIDFIDMVLESNRDLVLRRLLECLGRDRTKHQVAEVTSLGLVQMTRKRVGQGLLESFSETCVHCNGRGVIVHMEQPTAVGAGARRPRG